MMVDVSFARRLSSALQITEISGLNRLGNNVVDLRAAGSVPVLPRAAVSVDVNEVLTGLLGRSRPRC